MDPTVNSVVIARTVRRAMPSRARVCARTAGSGLDARRVKVCVVCRTMLDNHCCCAETQLVNILIVLCSNLKQT